MPDITIITDGFAQGNLGGGNRRTMWATPLVGYYFYDDAGGAVNYAKTDDGGATWAAPVEFHDASGQIACWPDWRTAGDSGNLIHVAIIENAGHTVFYRSLDTEGDVISSAVQLQDWAGSVSLVNGRISITKAVGGNLYVSAKGLLTGNIIFQRSVDGGVSWTTRREVPEGHASVALPY